MWGGKIGREGGKKREDVGGGREGGTDRDVERERGVMGEHEKQIQMEKRLR